MTAYAGVPRKRKMSPIPVSLTRKGYPRPSFHRRMMYVKNEKVNKLVNIFLFSNNMIRASLSQKPTNPPPPYPATLGPCDL